MKLNNPTKIGLMVIIAGMILIVLTVKAGNFNLYKDGYRMKVVFFDIDGVHKNSPVMFNGYEVGVVEAINIVYDERTKMELTLFIRSQIKINAGVSAHIKNLGFMGEKYVALTGGKSEERVIAPGTVIHGEEPTDFGMLMASGNDVLNKFNRILANVDERLDVNKQNIDSIVANTTVTLNNLVEISDNFKTTLSTQDKNIETMLENFRDMSGHLNTSSANLEEMSQDLKLNPWKLLRKVKEQEVVK